MFHGVPIFVPVMGKSRGTKSGECGGRSIVFVDLYDLKFTIYVVRPFLADSNHSIRQDSPFYL